jgi:hypothetical protein
MQSRLKVQKCADEHYSVFCLSTSEAVTVMNLILPLLLLGAIFVSTICLASDKTKNPPELADVVVGIYHGDVISDSKDSSRSDVTVTITKIDKRTVRVSSDYDRLGAVVIPLTRIDDKILNADGDTPLVLDLGQPPPRLDYSPHNEVSYAGHKQ